jgi:ubiquitin
VTVGALLPLTGDAASIGANVNSTIRVAESDVNNYLAANNVVFACSSTSKTQERPLKGHLRQ